MRAPCLVHSCVLTGRRGRELSGASLQGAFLFLGLHLRGLITSQRPCMTWGIRTSTYTFWGDVEIQTIAVAMCVTIQGGFVIKLTQELRKVNQPFLDTCYLITRKKNLFLTHHHSLQPRMVRYSISTSRQSLGQVHNFSSNKSPKLQGIG